MTSTGGTQTIQSIEQDFLKGPVFLKSKRNLCQNAS